MISTRRHHPRSTAGYSATGFLYLPDRDLKVYGIPGQPTPDLIRISVDWILTPIAEFPFVSEDDHPTPLTRSPTAAAGSSVRPRRRPRPIPVAARPCSPR